MVWHVLHIVYPYEVQEAAREGGFYLFRIVIPKGDGWNLKGESH